MTGESPRLLCDLSQEDGEFDANAFRNVGRGPVSRLALRRHR
jgi:hypothetical protein